MTDRFTPKVWDLAVTHSGRDNSLLDAITYKGYWWTWRVHGTEYVVYEVMIIVYLLNGWMRERYILMYMNPLVRYCVIPRVIWCSYQWSRLYTISKRFNGYPGSNLPHTFEEQSKRNSACINLYSLVVYHMVDTGNSCSGVRYYILLRGTELCNAIGTPAAERASGKLL
jgi:hypothetical protein